MREARGEGGKRGKERGGRRGATGVMATFSAPSNGVVLSSQVLSGKRRFGKVWGGERQVSLGMGESAQLVPTRTRAIGGRPTGAGSGEPDCEAGSVVATSDTPQHVVGHDTKVPRPVGEAGHSE